MVRNNSVLLIDKQLQNQLRKRQRQRLIQNWRPIFLLNIDFKIISKALSKRLKNVLSSLFSDNQSAYVDGRFSELQITAMLQLDGTVDIQKAFDSVNHQF